MKYRSWIMAAAVAVVAMASTMARAESIATVPVGNVGNANDSTGFGSVSYSYSIGKYDVTNAQYAEFLNAKATSSDPLALWNSYMGSNVEGGITRSGTGSGPYTYTIKSGMANMPVVDVSWFDTLRFANWLNNGQGNGSTEIGSYTLLGGTPTPSNASTISRNAGAQWVLPSENEWYKAAYYDPTLNSGSGGYWLYPTRSNTAPVNILSSTGTNNANFYDYYGTGTHGYSSGSPFLTDVGAFAASPGPYGTFDQGGDVWQWNETDIFGDGSSRGLRGGGWHSYSIGLASSYRDHYYPTYEGGTYIGFRVASVPEPGSLVMTAMIAVSGLLYYWRKHA